MNYADVKAMSAALAADADAVAQAYGQFEALVVKIIARIPDLSLAEKGLLLYALHGTETVSPQQTAADSANDDVAAVSALIHRLEAKGFLKRADDAPDPAWTFNRERFTEIV